VTTVQAPAGAIEDQATGTTFWGWVAAGSVAVAGALHVAAAADHLAAGDVVVGFFLLVALLQVGTGIWLAVGAVTRSGHPPWPVAAALALTVGLLVLYRVVHTTDLLAGVVPDHHHGGAASPTHGAAHVEGAEPEGPVALGLEPADAGTSPGLLGTATVAVELVSVLALTALLPAVLRRHAANGLLVLGALIWVAWFTGAFV
jgi:hypothetical protein